MPLAFPSESHGEIAFGFFNVDGDMLLLERTFFFAGDFCRAVTDLASAGGDFETVFPGWVIDRREDVGDLMGAIHGIRHTGFLGDVYRRYPFPERPEDFRQKTTGHETRDVFCSLIEPWARAAKVRLVASAKAREVKLAEVRFGHGSFGELVRYVLRGGWPRWENDEAPEEVRRMGAAVAAGEHWAVRGIETGRRRCAAPRDESSD
jgi:hypothetical protein